MAGGDGRRTAKSVAAATGEVGALQRCSNKRKVVTGGHMLRPCTAGKKDVKEETALGAVCAAEAKKNVLSNKEIKWILAQKPLAVPRRYAELKRSNPELAPRPGEEVDESKRRLYVAAKTFFAMEERFPKLQQWVREQLATKGEVVLDDEWAKRKAKAQAMVDREWPKIEAIIQDILRIQGQTRCQSDEQSDSDEEEDDD